MAERRKKVDKKNKKKYIREKDSRKDKLIVKLRGNCMSFVDKSQCALVVLRYIRLKGLLALDCSITNSLFYLVSGSGSFPVSSLLIETTSC